MPKEHQNQIQDSETLEREDDPRNRLNASCERLLAETQRMVAKKAESISDSRAASNDSGSSPEKQVEDWLEAENQLCDRLDKIAESMALDITVAESARSETD